LSAEVWTIQQLLNWCTEDFRKRGLDSPRLDAELLVAHALEVDRVRLYLDFERPLVPDERARVRALVERRRRREPVAYILGERGFYGRMFKVGPNVLVPRPDTETLVERALALLPAGEPAQVLDVGTGSGCLGLTLAAERPDARVTLVDISDAALQVAAQNAELLGVSERVTLLRSDLFQQVRAPEGGFDLIVSNPPYIPSSDVDGLMPDVREHEPRLALDGGRDGFDCIRQLVAGASQRLRPGGALLIELGVGQSDEGMQLLRDAGYEGVQVHRDLGRVPRVIEGRRA
jgi:release factor glutamine methyltransferase